MFDRTSPSRRRLAALAAAILLTPETEAAMPDPLQRYIGKSRVLLVFAPGEDDPALREQRRILASAAQEARQRDLVVVEILGGSVKNLGHYAASWIAGWPNRPSSTAALT